MFKAKSDITGISIKDLILLDYKKFEEKNTSFGIGVAETVLPKAILDKRQKILELLPQIKKQRKLDLMFFSVVDIIKQQTHLFAASEKEKLIAEKGFKKKIKNGVMFLPGVVSRKKQIVPIIINAL
jgi:manganese-dependent inorganic pyrophosphatase